MRYKHAMKSGFWLLAVFFFFLPVSVQAEETALNTHVTPLFPESQVDESKGYYELLLAPGQKETLKLKVGNSSDLDPFFG
ncbi:WxL protein peptidoglycan domain-containing protein [Enterococcus casseliflavus]|uniref:WxL protein peptidoglycan domain-containing protein n=1 Tax=Enterococcus casseliflavus TaxID=37734 RepID=UPI003A4DEB60